MQCGVNARVTVTGDVQREGRRALYEPPTGVIGSSSKEGEDGYARLLGFRKWGAQSEKSKIGYFWP